MIHLLTDIDLATVRVAIYWNLSKDVWSIKLDESHGAYAKGKVVAWSDEPLTLTDAVFHVSRAQHQTGLAGTGRRGTKRNVVAWVSGKLADGAQVIAGRRVTFHWSDARSTFHSVDDGAPIARAGAARFAIVSRDGRRHGQVFI